MALAQRQGHQRNDPHTERYRQCYFEDQGSGFPWPTPIVDVNDFVGHSEVLRLRRRLSYHNSRNRALPFCGSLKGYSIDITTLAAGHGYGIGHVVVAAVVMRVVGAKLAAPGGRNGSAQIL